MANIKTGFNYYNVDTDRYQDRRIKRLKKDFRCDGIAVYDYVLCEIYRVEGCFLEWDENTAFDVSEYFGIKESTVSEIVKYCGSVGLFDKTLLSRGIITSLSIQRRYLEMCKRAKRTNIKIPSNILIQEESVIIPEESPIIPEISQESTEVSPQSKVEYSKEEESIIYIEGESFFVSPIYLNLLKEMLSDICYLEQSICMNMKINLQIAQDWLKRYFVKLTSEGSETLISLKEARQHFANWLRIELEKISKAKKGGNNGTERRKSIDNKSVNQSSEETSPNYSERFI